MTPCWNGFCVAEAHDGDDRHVDATGYGWTQARGTVYCPACQDHHAPGDCPRGYVSPVVTLYDRDLVGGGTDG
jgi:hypothetical protein